MVEKGIGKQIRDARVIAGLTINDVAERSGFSPSYISQVEREMANPSLSAISRIGAAVGLEIGNFFSGNGAVSFLETAGGGSDVIPTGVVRHDHRKKLIYPGSNLVFELLCPDLQHAMEIHKTTAPPNLQTNERISHGGEECAIVLKGVIEITVGDETFTLEAGDSIYFDGRKPHYWKNVGAEDLEVIWIITPPQF